MPALDDAGLDARRRARVDRALEADPALAAELDLITALLDVAVSRAFWSAFASECARCERPAAAVLAALERAAATAGRVDRGGGRRASGRD